MTTDSLYLSTVFLGGIFSFLSPCVLPLLPVYLSTLASTEALQDTEVTPMQQRLHLVFRTLLFVSGIAFCFVLLGFGAGSLGSIINSRSFLTTMGLVAILLGIHQTGLIPLPLLYREKKLHLNRSGKRDAFGTFLLGFTFSFGWTPCIGPVLAAILGIAAGGGSALYGGLLMFVYSLGFAIPFLVLALFSDILLKKIKGLNRHLNKIKIIGGLLIIFMGILLMTNNLNIITPLIGGIIK